MEGIDADSSFIVYYGDNYYEKPANYVYSDASTWGHLNYKLLNDLAKFDVVVLQPNQPHCTPEVINYLKANGVDYVIGYISIGEDFQPYNVFHKGDGSGPVALVEKKLQLTNANKASFYLDIDKQNLTVDPTLGYDQNTLPSGSSITSIIDVHTVVMQTPDGKVDLNPTFLGYMVNPDETWRELINHMRIGGDSEIAPERKNKAGLAQLVGTRVSDPAKQRDRTKNFGFDGFFLDTIDTAGPFEGDGWYPWALKEMTKTIKFISDTYPDHTVFANRGGFYFQAGLKSPVTHEYPTQYSIRPYVNAFLFESYMYDSGPQSEEGGVEYSNGASEFFYDNKFHQMPKILAEANRADGFTIFTLEYAEGRLGSTEQAISPELINNVIEEGVNTFGATASVSALRELNTVNTELLDTLSSTAVSDTSPPTWTNTSYAAVLPSQNAPSVRPREGVQELALGRNAGDVIVRWGVAQDRSWPVNYNIYYNTTPNLSTATKMVAPRGSITAGEGYNLNPISHFANELLLSGFSTGQEYFFWVRAEDSADGMSNEDANTNMKSIVVVNPITNKINGGIQSIRLDGDLSDWRALRSFPSDPNEVNSSSSKIDLLGISFAHDETDLYIAYEFEAGSDYTFPNYRHHLYLDTDASVDTGYSEFGQWAIGADYLLEGTHVFIWDNDKGDTGDWQITGVQADVVVNASTGVAELKILLDELSQPEYVRAIFRGISDTFGEPDLDRYPDGLAAGGASQRHVSYDFANIGTISNPVSYDFFQIDGLLNEWPQLRAHQKDPDDVFKFSDAQNVSGVGNQANWRQISVAHTVDTDHIFFGYENNTNIYISWGFQIFIDSDQDKNTGYNCDLAGVGVPIGADYLVEGINILEYVGDGSCTQLWEDSWSHTGNTVGRVWSGKTGEVFLFREWIGNPDAFDFFMFGNNGFYGNSGVYDFYPDIEKEKAFFSYDIH